MNEQNQAEQRTNEHPVGAQPPQTPQSSQTQSIQKENQRMKILLGVLTITLLGLIAFFVLSQSFSFKLEPKNNGRVEESPIPQASNSVLPKESATPAPATPQASVTPTATPVTESRIEDTDTPNQKKYVSKLGVSFLFMEKFGGESFLVKELGNKIYVYSKNSHNGYEGGQYIELFEKDPHDSLVQALQKKFMQGYSAADCLVQDEVQASQTKTMVFANMMVSGQFIDIIDLLEKAEKCPQPYTKTNGLSYFQADTRYFDRFAFMSVGQDVIPGKPDGSGWHTTIEFF